MLKKWLSWLNKALISTVFLLAGIGTLVAFSRPSEIELPEIGNIKRALPKSSFEAPKDLCDAIGTNNFELKFCPLGLQLPDLRTHLIYYGKNGRPDAVANRVVMHFSFLGNTTISSLMEGERLYLSYDRSRTPNQYVFSANNIPTSLWIEASTQGNEATITVKMKNEQGDIIVEPASYAQFRLTEKESNARGAGKSWELGKWRVDGSLLARQKGSWKGLDRFLERHGGEEYKFYQNKHRIDFTDEDKTYSVYVGVNDTLSWDKDHWKNVLPGDETLNSPLMIIKKIDDRLMNLELWDVEGKNKISLNLVRTSEAWAPQTLQESFQCLGARTRSQYIFEIDEKRMLLSPQDWLLQTEEGWVKLSTPEEIDSYVERQRTGLLFIFDGVSRKEGKQVLTAVVFNTARTEMQEIEIAVQKGAIANNGQKEKGDRNKDKDDDEDDEDEDSFEEEVT